MAEIEALNISVDVTQAMSSLSKLDQQIAELKAKQDELKNSTASNAEEQKKIDEEYLAVSNSIQVLVSEKKALNRETQNAIKQAKSEKGSLESLRAEVANGYREYAKMSEAQRESAEGQAFIKNLNDQNDKLKELEEAVGDYRRSVGGYAKGIEKAFGNLPTAFGKIANNGFKAFAGLKEGAQNFGKALKTLAKNPWIAAISVLIGLFMALKERIAASEENSNKLSQIMARFKPILDTVTNALDALIGYLLDYIDLMTSMYTKIAEFFAWVSDSIGLTDNAQEAVENYKKTVEEYVQLEKDRQQLARDNRQLTIDEAHAREKTMKLMDEEMDAEKSKDWQKAKKKLNEARQTELDIMDKKIASAKENLRIMQEEAAQASNNEEANKKLADAEAHLIDLGAEKYAKNREYSKKEKAINEKALSEAKAHKDAMIAVQKTITDAQINLMEEGRQKALERIKADYNARIVENNARIEEYYQKGWKKEAEMLMQYNKLINTQMDKAIAESEKAWVKSINQRIQALNNVYNVFLTSEYEIGSAEWIKGKKLQIAQSLTDMTYNIQDQFEVALNAIKDKMQHSTYHSDLMAEMFFGKEKSKLTDKEKVALKEYTSQFYREFNDYVINVWKDKGVKGTADFLLNEANPFEAFAKESATYSKLFKSNIYGIEQNSDRLKTLNEDARVYLFDFVRRAEMINRLNDSAVLANKQWLIDQEKYNAEYKKLIEARKELDADMENDIVLNKKLDEYDPQSRLGKWIKAEFDWTARRNTMQIQQEQNKLDTLLAMQEEYHKMNHEKDERYAERSIEIDKQVFDQKMKLLSAKQQVTRSEMELTAQLLGNTSSLIATFDEQSKTSVALQQTLGLAQVAINQGIAISEAVKQNAAGSISPIQFALKMALSVVTITASIASAVKAINSAKYARGGLIGGKGSGTSDDNYVRVSRGESVINAQSTKQFAPLLSAINEANGGRAIVINGVASGVDNNNFIANQMALALRSMPAPQVDVQEISRTQNRVSTIQQRARY